MVFIWLKREEKPSVQSNSEEDSERCVRRGEMVFWAWLVGANAKHPDGQLYHVITEKSRTSDLTIKI